MFDFIQRIYKVYNPPAAPKDASPLRFGILGAARIAPNALILPAISHPDVVVAAVAARDKARAEAYAKKHGIEKVYGGKTGYLDLLNDPDIDVIYNPLPNGLHFEWTMRALAAGKHVLLEKPSSSNADETRRMFELAREKNLVLLEAFHYRFHPAIQRIKEIIDSGELGKVKSIVSMMALPKGLIHDDDIRFQFDLSGGCMMDMGVYPLSAMRYLLDAEPLSIESSIPIPHHLNPTAIDRGFHAVLAFPNSVTAELSCDYQLPLWGLGPFRFLPRGPQSWLTVHLEGGDISTNNFIIPTFYHYIQVSPKAKGTKARTEKVYTFPKSVTGGGNLVEDEAWWTSYRYQLEAFVNRVKGREPQTWVSGEDSIKQMEAVERIYEKAGMPPRPTSSFTVT
ncbi:hypothetical protein BOTBODRAFT_131922 [Botryobasidium botryosum FD-172 SS1]|uniref:D-xylose 1-dehydrogenase (NADP(+), D-xylono-1,5-lactone-forming) n=1 Tax=Botryobasidium botryosum (strain FD-172 SS1) TaxID=930990 RepID=A0A067MGK6_BOTB1|nr:hypothetical protein BOTBODRAFT_131922 [Botryobasidium botryosum FD-172 SS1]